MLLDRTAVLVVGLVAGFVVGHSFVGSEPPPVVTPGNTAVTPPPPAGAVPAPPAVATTTAGSIDPRVVNRVKADGRIRIGVFGDSFGNGVWDALYRQLPRDEGYDVLRFSKEATGFTRYRTLDLTERARQQVAGEPIDIAVISFGANDAQDIYADGRLQPLLGGDWKRTVGERLDQFVAAVRSTGAIVYWVGLPAMRDPKTDAQMQAMNGFFAEHMRRLGVTYVDTRPLSVNEAGQYDAHLPDPRTGRRVLMRTGDGVHMIGIGYQRITGSVADDARAFADRARRAAGVPAPAATAEAGA